MDKVVGLFFKRALDIFFAACAVLNISFDEGDVMKRVTPLIIMLLFVSFTSLAQFLTSAKLYMRYKEFDKAEASALKAVEKDPDEEEAWYILGQARYELKKYPEMIEAFDKALAINKDHATEISNLRRSVWANSFNAGIRYYNGGKDTAGYYEQAIASFKTAILAQPESSATYYVAGLSHYANKDYDGAIALLNTCIAKDPKKIEAIQLLGQLHSQLARDKKDAKDEAGAKMELSKAAAAYEKLYEAAPTNAENIINLIDVYERAGLGDKAESLTSNCVKTNPNNRICRYAYGVYLLKKDKFAESIEQLKAMTELEPDNKDEMYKDATYNLGVAYLNWGVGMKEADDKRLEEARKAQKGKKGKAAELKEDLSYKDKFKAALPYLEKTADMRPDDANLQTQLGRLYANLNMTKEAKAAYDKADMLIKGK
jgi:tetratricopeptide (TPR) repeat protein